MFQHLQRNGGLGTHLGYNGDGSRLSADYYTYYVALQAVDSPEDSIKMNQSVELTTQMKFGTPRGRALVSLNPKLKEFFRDLNGDTILEPGETYTVTGKARKNISPEELKEAFAADGNWLYRVSVLI